MKQIVLILLFIFTVQKSIHYNPQKNNEPHKNGSHYEISPSQNCEPGYFKKCILIGIIKRFESIPKRCFCYDKKYYKIKRNLNEVSTTKVKDKNIRDESPKYYPFRGKIEKVYRSIAKCHGDYYVCYNYPLIKVTACHCSKNPY